MGESTNQEAGALLDELLASLLDDFEHWFQRGEELLQACPEEVMPLQERQRMEERLQDGKFVEGAVDHCCQSSRVWWC